MQKISAQKRMQIAAGIFFVCLCTALDQFTKWLAAVYLKGHAAIPLIPEVFELSYLENRGAAFGILQGQKIFLVLITVVTMVLLVTLYFRIPEKSYYFYMRLVLILLISGAVGNFIDRCAHNYVIDFFYFKLIDFPVFNIADIYVTSAAILLVFLFLFYYKEEDLDMVLEQLIFWKKKEKN